MSKVLLLSMPYGNSYGKIDIKDLGFWVPPVGLAYLGSFLKQHNVDVRLVDLMFTSRLKEVFDIIKNESPLWVGLSATTPQISAAFKVAKIAKEIDSKIKVVIGGIHASALPNETISDPNIDILAYGEGELTMLELVEGKALDQIKGIIYKDGKEIIRNEPRELVCDLDVFPYPLYEHLPINRYGSDHFGAILGIISSRGCPHQCVYCAANTIHNRRYRTRSIDNVMGEIEKLKSKFSARRFSFYDDTFTLDSRRTIAICEELIKRKLNLEWNCITRADRLTKSLLELMKRAGCNTVQIGIESGDNEILRLAKRKETVEDSFRAVKWAKELGMEVVGLFIIGLPYETKKTIRKTIDIAKKLNVDYAQFSILVPLPGSEVWDMAREGKEVSLINSDWDNFGRYGKSIIRLKDVTEDELSSYFIKAYREFYLRPSYVLKRLKSTRNLKDINSLFKRGMALVKMLIK